MELKAELKYPYTEEERVHFIIEQNHKNGYEIREVSREKNTEITVPDYADVTETVEVSIPYVEMEQREIEVEKPIFETDKETREMVQTGVETVIETIEEPVKKVRIEEQEVTMNRQVGSHIEVKTEIEIDLQAWGYTEEEIEERKKEHIKSLTCTKRVFALMLQELGITYGQLKTLIASNEQAELEWDLCVELQRSNPLLDIMAMQLSVTSEQLDKLFQYANGEITLEEFKEVANAKVDSI